MYVAHTYIVIELWQKRFRYAGIWHHTPHPEAAVPFRCSYADSPRWQHGLSPHRTSYICNHGKERVKYIKIFITFHFYYS